MDTKITKRAGGGTIIHRRLDVGLASIELDIPGTNALGEFLGASAILSGGITIAARGEFPVATNRGHVEVREVFALTIVRRPQGFNTLAVDLGQEYFPNPDGPRFAKISAEVAEEWIEALFDA